MKDALGHGSNPRPTSGFTVDQRGNTPQHGFMVSRPGYEKSLPGRPSARQEVNYMRTNQGALHQSGNYFGAWGDSGKTYLDVSHNVANRRAAVREGIAAHQLAIYDLDHHKSVNLPSERRH